MRLAGKVAVVIGAGQSPGVTVGNGRATALRFAEEGAKVLAVDRVLTSAAETADLIRTNGGEAFALAADVTKSDELAAAIRTAHERWGRLDILHNNVGVALGDKDAIEIEDVDFDRFNAINLRGMIMACKFALPIMREQRSGCIINVSSTAAWDHYAEVCYKTTKAGVIVYTQQLALQNAAYGIRANVLLPGLMDTPMAVDTRSRIAGVSRESFAADRDKRVPLRGKQGNSSDVANAALFLASEEASYITGVSLPVDGGWLLRVGN